MKLVRLLVVGRVTEVGEPPFYAGGRGGNGVVIVSYPTKRN